MSSERDAFGPRLKAERDRRGITLQAIADSTKISISFLAALERNDMRRWPKGIFRRSFVREYALAVGLHPEPIVAEFGRLFPDGPCKAATSVPEFRLTLERVPSASWHAVRARVLLAVVEVCGVLTLGSAAAWWFDTRVWSTCGALALVYYPVAGILVERVPRPRILLRSLGPTRWLRAVSATIRKPWPLLPRPALSMHTPAADSTDTPGTAPEWRTASN